ncbi:MAG: class II aldolase/adducin family protein [Candidatus Omnitrophota bacterium]
MNIEFLKNEISRIGKLLWDKNLATGFNGNISARLDAHTVLITATQTSLGFLKPEAIVVVNLEGQVVGSGKASSETFLHTAVYKQFPHTQAVVHTHSTYTNGFFLNNERFTPKTFEARFYLGEVKSIPQTTPTVTDIAPVVEEMKANNVVVLRNHGVVAMGPDLFRAFVLIQELEEQVKMDFVSLHYQKSMSFPNVSVGNLEHASFGSPRKTFEDDKVVKRYKLFSKEQIEEIVKTVNSDTQLKELGAKTAMNMTLAVILDETQQSFRFTFENGQITQVAQDANAEFVINAPENIWRGVFNGQLDPFVATTQKKMTLKGDFARISKWYAPCSRIFQLWTKVAVE